MKYGLLSEVLRGQAIGISRHFVVVCYIFSTFVILCTVCMKLRIISQVYIVESEKM